ncbi:PQQ-binding-like beta-propeller repeat protein [Halosimplex sp. TS25]|uniref:PQQ-binding-like beta-propeller repeat protein n=1 Tax=Halosimplex rarum TaxID=3396619 RepID=UPI0039EB583B
MREKHLGRRELLAGAGAAVSLGLAGCTDAVGVGGDENGGGSSDRSGPLDATNEADWPMFGANAERNPVLTGTSGPEGPVREEWTFESHYVSPSVRDGTVYVDSSSAYYALDAATGDVLWERESESDGSMTPMVTEDALYTFDGGGLTALDPEDGTHRWTDDTVTGGFPVPRDGVLYGANGDDVFAFDLGDREMRWTSPLESEDTADGNYLIDVAADGSHVYTVEGVGEVSAYSLDGGERQWTLSSAYIDDSTFTLSVAGGTVYLATVLGASGKPTLRAIDASSGDVQWTDTVGIMSGVTADRLYADQKTDDGDDAGVFALDPATGDRIEELSGVTSFWGNQPVVADETLYYSADSGIYAYDLEADEMRWEHTDSHLEIDELLVAGDRVFFKTGTTLRALGPAE